MKRSRLIKYMVNELNECQTQESYYFEEDNATIIWVGREQGYYLLRGDQTWDFATPGSIETLLEQLSDNALREYAK